MIGCLNSDSRLINATVSALSLAYDYDGESVGSLSYSLAQGVAKSFSYQYDENGNIVSEQVTVDGVSADITAYEYDADNQLVSAENSSIKWTYSYDGRGNITAENEYSVSVNESGEKVYTPKENGADSYTYDTAWKDKLTSYNGQTISYDASGNPTSYLGHNLSWTMGRQLASYDNIAYSYNEIGIRTSKTVGENTTEFYLNGTNIIYQTDGTSDIYFFYDRNNELVGFKYSGNNYFYVKNQMGDITDIADENGNIVASYSYDPWGSVLSVTGSDTAIGNLNPFRYRSYYYDSDIQMYYLQSRYYDPGVGRFINCDDVNYIGLTESEISYNPFAYCKNNPINSSDISGTFPLSYVVNTAISVLFSVADYFLELLIKNYVLKERETFSLWDFTKAAFSGALSGFISNINFGKIINFAITCIQSWHSIDREKYTRFEALVSVLIISIISTIVSNKLSFGTNKTKTVKKYDKQVTSYFFKSIKKNNYKIVRDMLKRYFNRMSKTFAKYSISTAISTIFSRTYNTVFIKTRRR